MFFSHLVGEIIVVFACTVCIKEDVVALHDFSHALSESLLPSFGCFDLLATNPDVVESLGIALVQLAEIGVSISFLDRL